MAEFKPMLSGKVLDVHQLKYPLLMSPKLDGIRAVVVGGVVLSRTLEPIPNRFIQKVLGHKKYDGLDGELMVGAPTNAFREATAGIMRVEGKPDFTFHVFDDFTKPFEIYRKRYVRLCSRISGVERIKVLDHIDARYPKEVVETNRKFLYEGYEGTMLRSPEGVYKFGRSTAKEGLLLKLKQFEDSEAEVIGLEELEHNQNEATVSKVGSTKRSSAKSGRVAGGMLGALTVRDIHTGVEFSVGSGFDHQEREELWKKGKKLIGKLIKYQYFPSGSKEKPRFPTFKGFRDPRDL